MANIYICSVENAVHIRNVEKRDRMATGDMNRSAAAIEFVHYDSGIFI